LGVAANKGSITATIGVAAIDPIYIYIYIYIYIEPISGDHVVAVINLKKKIIVVREIFVLDPNCDAFERFCARSLLT
jgi:hypothetical protein